jgi:hypothetical protein
MNIREELKKELKQWCQGRQDILSSDQQWIKDVRLDETQLAVSFRADLDFTEEYRVNVLIKVPLFFDCW